MKKSALARLILTCLFAVVLCRWNTYVDELKTWREARNYCVEYYTDLSSISNMTEHRALLEYPNRNRQVWIGLYKDNSDTWKWAGGGNATFFKWSGGPLNPTNKCAVLGIRSWRNMSCTEKHHFFCSKHSLVLVKEKKTWEEAMEWCRARNQDLVSLPSNSTLDKTLEAIKGAQTQAVWTGLRYLADDWLWVSGETRSYWDWSLVETPQCPVWSHRCGALSLRKKSVEAWDCAEKLNFVWSFHTWLPVARLVRSVRAGEKAPNRSRKRKRTNHRKY
uniref:C-type lectin domain-containing protein n=1 Tax=Cyclopterus lumpus TaxID=8103 RepID=A0A8C2WC40_CYCLU